MFDELLNITSQKINNFSDNVRDDFGRSIVSDIFEPILQETSHLKQMRELFQTQVADIDKTINNLPSIGSRSHEQR